MSKKRSKELEATLAGLPAFVGQKEIEQSRERLRRNAGFDFDAFLDSADPERALSEPLGGTPQCLSPFDMATLQSNTMEPTRLKSFNEHLRSCEECRNNFRLFDSLESELVVEDTMVKVPDTECGDIALSLGISKPSKLDLDSLEINGIVMGRIRACREYPGAGVNDRQLYRAIFHVDLTPFKQAGLPVFDWLKIYVKTVSGIQVRTKSFVSFTGV